MDPLDQLVLVVEACRVSRVLQDLLAHLASKVIQVLLVQLLMSQDQLDLQALLEQVQLVQEDLKETQEIQDQLAHQVQVLQVNKDLAELKVRWALLVPLDQLDLVILGPLVLLVMQVLLVLPVQILM
jgi:hypothetical protein